MNVAVSKISSSPHLAKSIRNPSLLLSSSFIFRATKRRGLAKKIQQCHQLFFSLPRPLLPSSHSLPLSLFFSNHEINGWNGENLPLFCCTAMLRTPRASMGCEIRGKEEKLPSLSLFLQSLYHFSHFRKLLPLSNEREDQFAFLSTFFCSAFETKP